MKFLRFIVVFSIFWESQIAFGSVFPNDYHSKRKLLAAGGTIEDADKKIVYFAVGGCTVTRISTTHVATHKTCSKAKICQTPTAGTRRKRQDAEDDKGDDGDATEAAATDLTDTTETPTDEEGVIGKQDASEATADTRTCAAADATLPAESGTSGDLLIIPHDGTDVMEVDDTVAADAACTVVGYGDTATVAAAAAAVKVTKVEGDIITVTLGTAGTDILTAGDQGGALICTKKLAGVVSKYDATAIEVTKTSVLVTAATPAPAGGGGETGGAGGGEGGGGAAGGAASSNKPATGGDTESTTSSSTSLTPLTLMVFFPVTVATFFTQ